MGANRLIDCPLSREWQSYVSTEVERGLTDWTPVIALTTEGHDYIAPLIVLSNGVTHEICVGGLTNQL